MRHTEELTYYSTTSPLSPLPSPTITPITSHPLFPRHPVHYSYIIIITSPHHLNHPPSSTITPSIIPAPSSPHHLITYKFPSHPLLSSPSLFPPHPPRTCTLSQIIFFFLLLEVSVFELIITLIMTRTDADL